MKLQKNTKKSLLTKKRVVILTLCFAVIGAILVTASRAATTTTPNAQCGARVSNYTYKVPFGNAIWNQTVCNVAKDSRSAEYAERLYKWGNLNDGSAGSEALWGDLSISAAFPKPTATDPDGLSTLFSRNVYNAKDATVQKLVQTTVAPSNLDGSKSVNSSDNDRLKYLPDTRIPWNPNWLTGEAGDNEIIILDEVNGRIYEISGYKRGLAATTQCGPFVGDRLCAYSVKVGRDSKGNYFDYRTYEGPFNSRGIGLSQYATLTTPQEIAAGEIRHALGIAIPNTAAGPVCSLEQQGTAAEGTLCGTAVAPASKFEFNAINAAEKAKRYNYTPSVAATYTQNKLIPEGMRFALNIDDAYIENWINSRADLKANARKAQTARIFAKALKDYGMIVADTSGNKSRVQVAGMVNPVTRDAWKSVGVETDADTNLLEGLIKLDRLYVVSQPTVTCIDGKVSTYYCDWTKAEYTQSTINTVQTQTPSTSTTTPTLPAPMSMTATTSSSDKTAPTMPSGFNVSMTYDWTKLKYAYVLNWSASSDNVGVYRYVIKRNGLSLATPSKGPYKDFGFKSGQTYEYSVQAQDLAGNLSVATPSIKIKDSCALIFCTATVQ
jgi:hypothetical protein